MAAVKKFISIPLGNIPGRRVKIEGGGEVPKVLSGTYTSKEEADQAINMYLRTRRNANRGKSTDK